MEKAIAIVVSYNRLDLLKECISALKNQSRKLDGILVINNGSTDGTERWLNTIQDVFYITQANSGSGGGFQTGINWAYKNGYSWIWCMDDDGLPKEDAFEQLIKNVPNHQCLLNSAVINKEDKESFVWKTKNYSKLSEVTTSSIKGIGHPFNGTLIHRSIVANVGFPKANLFLWGDETEYYYRIVKQHKIPVYTITGSVHYHPSATFNLKQDWNFNACWKMYYYVRNRFHVHKAKHPLSVIAWINYISFLAAFFFATLVYQRTNRLKKLSFIAWPAKDAISNNFSATPSIILARFKTWELPGYGHTIQIFIRNVRYYSLRLFAEERPAKTAKA